MNLFFDVDYTLVAMDGSLRPRSLEALQDLKNDGHDLYVWSGNGIRTREMDKHGLSPLLSGVYEKPLGDYAAGLQTLGIPVWPDLVIDDYQDIVSFFGGVWVAPYFFHNADDREMERVCRLIRQVSEDGTHRERGYYPPRNSR